MVKHILVGDDDSVFCRLMEKRLGSVGFSAESCRLSEIRRNIRDSGCSAVIYPTQRNIADALDTLDAFPEIPMIFMIYSSSETVVRKLLAAGAEMCIIMPATSAEVCESVMNTLCSGDAVMSDISAFLLGLGFPGGVNGFYYLCTAVELSVCDPSLLTRMVSGLYKRVAERFRTDASLVERSVRHVAKLTAKSGAFSRLVGTDTAYTPSCSELIRAAADGFVRKHRIY